MNGPIGAHGERRAQRLLHAIGTEGDGDHLALAALLLDSQRFLDGKLVIGRHDPGDARGLDDLAAAGDLHLRRRVGNLLDADDDLHERAPCRNFSPLAAPAPGGIPPASCGLRDDELPPFPRVSGLASYLSSRVIRKRSPGMKTWSKTTGSPAGP